MVTRQYQPIWEALKALSAKDAATKGVSITAPRPLHSRIIKAIIKEKWSDVAFKVTLYHKGRHAILSHVRQHSVLTFYLTYYVDHITVEEL